MAPRDPTQIPIAANGDVNTAPVGTTLPTTAAEALDAAFAPLGFLSDSGVTLSPSVDTLEVPAWQSGSPVRTIVSGTTRDIAYELLEWTEDSLVNAFGNAGVYTDNLDGTADFQPAPIDQQKEVACVIDGIDGSNLYRLVFERVTVVDQGEISFSREGSAMIPVTMRQLSGLFVVYMTQTALVP